MSVKNIQSNNSNFNKNIKQPYKGNEKNEKTYILSDLLKKGGCFGCLNKNCKITGEHGTNIPYQMCNFVKNPTYIEDIQKAIKDTDLYFYDKKPFFTICKYFHTECINCKELRIQFVEYNGKSFGVCCGKPHPNSNTITVGVHIDLKLIVNDNKYKVMAIPIEIDYEKLVKDYENNQVNTDFEEVIETKNKIESKDKIEPKVNELTKMMNINVNVVKNEGKKIVISDDIETIMEEMSEKIELIETDNLSDSFNIREDFPSLSPNFDFMRTISPINFSKIKNSVNENNSSNILIEQEITINNSINNLFSVSSDNYSSKNISDEISEEIMKDKNLEIKKLNDLLNKYINENEELKKNYDDLEFELNSKRKQLSYLNSENSELNQKKISFEIKNKELQRKCDEINNIQKDKDLCLIFKNYILNVKNINNAVIEALNDEYYVNIYHNEINVKSLIEKIF